jgi:uncharacterized protein (TIGR04255 family)
MNSPGREARLPEFEKPPVVEVVLSIQFKPLALFRTPHVGLFWLKFREKFPTLQESVPIQPSFEEPGSRPVKTGIRFEAVQIPPVPRYSC